jgi:alkylhydroperoxidase family enzyme
VSRILPLEPPYDAEVAQRLEAMMPPGVPPIALFRTFARNLPMAAAMGGWGGYELSRALSLSLRDREVLIDRTCARCGCQYEWGVHVAFFAERAGLDAAQVTSLTHGGPDDGCWGDRDRVLIALADRLHDTATIDDVLFDRARALLSDAELLDAFLLCGWYHAISFAANAAGVADEDGAPTFDSVRP